MKSKTILKLEIYDSQGKLHETQLIDFYVADENAIVITIGDYTYHLNKDGSLIAGVNKLLTPYD